MSYYLLMGRGRGENRNGTGRVATDISTDSILYGDLKRGPAPKTVDVRLMNAIEGLRKGDLLGAYQMFNLEREEYINPLGYSPRADALFPEIVNEIIAHRLPKGYMELDGTGADRAEDTVPEKVTVAVGSALRKVALESDLARATRTSLFFEGPLLSQKVITDGWDHQMFTRAVFSTVSANEGDEFTREWELRGLMPHLRELAQRHNKESFRGTLAYKLIDEVGDFMTRGGSKGFQPWEIKESTKDKFGLYRAAETSPSQRSYIREFYLQLGLGHVDQWSDKEMKALQQHIRTRFCDFAETRLRIGREFSSSGYFAELGQSIVGLACAEDVKRKLRERKIKKEQLIENILDEYPIHKSPSAGAGKIDLSKINVKELKTQVLDNAFEAYRTPPTGRLSSSDNADDSDAAHRMAQNLGQSLMRAHPDCFIPFVRHH